MKKPLVGVERDAGGRRFLTVTCPDCERTSRYPFSGLEAGTKLPCSCGVAFNFSQENLDALRERFGLCEDEESGGPVN